jgi:competence protein ComEA
MQVKDSQFLEYGKKLEDLVKTAGGLTRLQITVIAILLALIAIGAATAYLRSRPREINVKDSRAVSSSEEKRKLTVHIAGAVVRPGLYKLVEGARVADALSMAGGATPDGILDDVNLASRLKDGEKILVPRTGNQQSAPGNPAPSESSTLLNLNTADESDLDRLPGIGPSLAKRIVEYRKKNGPFSTVDEVDDVDGIGPRKLEEFRGQVTI